MRLLILLGFTLTMVACGSESSNGYTPTTDTASISALVTIDGEAIRIGAQSRPVSGDLIEECVVGFDKKDVLPYSFRSDEELVLGGQVFEFVRPLAAATSNLANADSRLFAVWKGSPFTIGLVTYSLEVEIHTDSIIYRNTCTR
ncbi:MAG: hypothetical protein EOP10_27740 [Proteobacteria bacterium]|nr:MAG: hypothetical protein EOP10_27740 [Pseudomonadota bacterium]